MFAAGKTAGASAGGGVDAQFNYVSMLLHGDGTNGAQNNTFIDSSSTGATVTRSGATTQGSFSPFGSNWSVYHTGSSYLSYPANGTTNFGSGEFTVEGWIFPTANVGDGSGIFAGVSGSGSPVLLGYNESAGYWGFGRNFISFKQFFYPNY
jgi:hypothetical protein